MDDSAALPVRQPLPPFASPFPPAIRTVGVFAPAGIPEPDRLARGLARLAAWGLTVVLPAVPDTPERYFAAPDATRAAHLHELLRNPHVDAIVAARGGFGCARLLDHLDTDLLRQRPVPLIGYSDVTVLHLLRLGLGVTTGYSGPMVASSLGRRADTPAEHARLAFSLQSLAAAWTPRPDVSLPAGTALQVLKPGTANGPVVPANLSLVVSLLDTPFAPALAGCILLLEDVNEAAYRVDRYLTQLRQAGVLDGLAGLVFGDFSDGQDSQYLPAILAEFAACVPGPVVAGLPFGHCQPTLTVPVGRPGHLVCSQTRVETLGW